MGYQQSFENFMELEEAVVELRETRRAGESLPACLSNDASVQPPVPKQNLRRGLLTVPFLGLVLAVGLASAPSADAAASCPPSPYRSSPPLVIAHASGSYFGPPNTIEMLRAAVRAGADVVDVDVRLSADGVLVAAHDDELGGVNNGEGSLRTQSFSALRKLDFAWGWRDPSGKFSLRGKGVKIPTVEEVLKAFPNRRVSLEFKVAGGEATLCRLLRRLDRTKDVYIGSAGDTAVDAFKPLCPEVTTTVTDAMVPILRAAQASGDPYCSPVPIGQPPFSRGNNTFVTNKSVEWNHAHGLAVYTWTLETEKDLRIALAAGVDGVYTGRADLARKIFGKRK
jgi:glycerophosphoryl diester phosphodiesterase